MYSQAILSLHHLIYNKILLSIHSISREADSDSEADGERLVELEEVLREHEPAQPHHHQHQLHLAIEPFR